MWEMRDDSLDTAVWCRCFWKGGINWSWLIAKKTARDSRSNQILWRTFRSRRKRNALSRQDRWGWRNGVTEVTMFWLMMEIPSLSHHPSPDVGKPRFNIRAKRDWTRSKTDVGTKLRGKTPLAGIICYGRYWWMASKESTAKGPVYTPSAAQVQAKGSDGSDCG